MDSVKDVLEKYGVYSFMLEVELLRHFEAMRNEIFDKGASEWKNIAYARLGRMRDKMNPEDVETIQNFLGNNL